MSKKFEMRLKGDREDQFERIEEEILPNIDRTSMTAGVEVAIKLGLKKMAELELEAEELKERKEDLESEYPEINLEI